MYNARTGLFLLFFVLSASLLRAQITTEKEIHWTANPSFEDTPGPGKVPKGWTNCSPPETWAPDVQPGYFKVKSKPTNGASYLTLMVYDNDTYNAVGQKLTESLAKDSCYEFSVDVCRDSCFKKSVKTGELTTYSIPVVVRIWGGNKPCERAEMLFETPVVINYRWLGFNFRVSPTKNSYSYLMIEAYYKTPLIYTYSGHVALDNLSPIRKVTCAPEAMPEMVEKKKETPRKDTVAVKPPPKKPVAPAPPVTTPNPPSVVSVSANMDRRSIKKGSVIRLDNLYFDANKYDIKPECESVLGDLARFLRNNPDIKVEVGGHTNNNPDDKFANELSSKRAQSVAEWLIQKGVTAGQIQHKGYGKTRPLLPNINPESRKKNQRVEITVLEVKGG
jgi:outer membrane protein OmpA-like peptidoglycan-associated protein